VLFVIQKNNLFLLWLNKKMQENLNDYKFSIKVALDNAKKRISSLDNSDKKCIIEEYKEWLNDELGQHTILLLREDPII
tara:strand:+ start:470 stop:706 length:237 start_codon:yes stop_codon:yes gene_type:complete